MNDEDLLIAAAKAAGMPPPVDEHGVWSAWVGSPENGHWWDPLEDDGDAFRLAMTLEMPIHPGRVWKSYRLERYQYFVESSKDVSPLSDPASTRRAIVGVAAEIGQQLP